MEPNANSGNKECTLRFHNICFFIVVLISTHLWFHTLGIKLQFHIMNSESLNIVLRILHKTVENIPLLETLHRF